MRTKNTLHPPEPFDIANILFMLLLCLVTLYPLWYCLVLSLNEGADAMRGGIFWWPRKPTVENYVIVFQEPRILTAFGVSIARTVIGTTLSLFVTSMAAYALMERKLLFRKVYLTLGTVTMFFSGGLIPYFFLIRRLGLYDNFLVYVLPGVFSFYFLLVFQTFFRSLSMSLFESARLDGANELTIFLRIVLPLSKPVLATIALFVGVGHWNDYFTGIVFVDKQNLRPISTYLYQVIAQASSYQMMERIPGVNTGEIKTVTSQSVRLATMMVATTPIILTYPWLQRYFVKGVMLGAVKG